MGFVGHHLRCRLVQFELRAHLLQASPRCSKILRLPRHGESTRKTCLADTARLASRLNGTHVRQEFAQLASQRRVEFRSPSDL